MNRNELPECGSLIYTNESPDVKVSEYDGVACLDALKAAARTIHLSDNCNRFSRHALGRQPGLREREVTEVIVEAACHVA